MKFYNPFKWHMVQDELGNIYIRKWRFGWEYLDFKDPFTWREIHRVQKWCKYPTIETAKAKLSLLNSNFIVIN